MQKLPIRNVLFKYKKKVQVKSSNDFLIINCLESKNANMRTSKADRDKERILVGEISSECRDPDNKLATRASRRPQIQLFGKLNLSKSRAHTPLAFLRFTE